MAAEREIVRYMHDIEACRALAARLAGREELAGSEQAGPFLEKIAGWAFEDPPTRRQVEFLLGIRDDNRFVGSLYDFDLTRVLGACWAARADVLDEDDVGFLERLKTRGGTTFRVAEARRLLRIARGITGVLD